MSFLFLLLLIILIFILIIRFKTNHTDQLQRNELNDNKILNQLDVEEKEKINSLNKNFIIMNNLLSDEKNHENELDTYIKKEKDNCKKRKQNIQSDNTENEDSLDFNDVSDALTYGISKILDLDPIEKLERIEKAKNDIKNSEFLGSVEFKESNKIYESTIIEKINENSKNFNADLFKKWAREIFETLQLGNLEDKKIVKDFTSEELFDAIFNQEQQLANDNLKYIKEDFTINNFNLYDYSKSLNKEEIQILVDVTLREYIIDTISQCTLKGNKKLKEKKYLMTFIKRNDIPPTIEKNCPNCGGTISNLELSRCKYCGTLIFPIRYDWTLIKLETF